MSGTDVSTKDLLLANLRDHRVVRVDGSLAWYAQLYQGLNQLQGISLVKLEGLLHFAEVEMRVSAAVAANTGMAVIWLDPREPDDNVGSYLLKLAQSDHDKPVVIVLVNSQRLDTFLSDLPAAMSVDGYYQEEIKAASPAVNEGGAKLVVGALFTLCVVGVGIWYLSGNDKELSDATVSAQTGSEVPIEKVVYAWDKPKVKAEVTAIASAPVEDASHPTVQPVPTDNFKPNRAIKELAPLSEKEILAELTAVIKSNSPEVKSNNESIVKKIAPVDEEAIQEAIEPVVSDDLSKQLSDEVSATGSVVEKIRQDEKPTLEAPPVLNKKIAPLDISSLKVQKASASREQKKPLINEFSLQAGDGILSSNELKEMISVVDRWARAWSAQDWANYIGSYIEGKPYGIKVSLEEWRAFRKDRLVSPEWVLLNFGKPTVTVYDPHWVKVELYQRFEKPGYADETTKRLELKRTLNGWRIASEATDGTVVLSR